jgi:hypothetical protein
MVPRNKSEATIAAHSWEGNFQKINQRWRPPFTKQILQTAADESILRFRLQVMKKSEVVKFCLGFNLSADP